MAELNAYQVAQKVAKELRRLYGSDSDLVVWSAKEARSFIPTGAPVVMWEGGPYDWAIELSFQMTEQFARDSGFYCEPVTSYCLGIYKA